MVPHLAELWQYSWVPAGEVPLHSRDCFVQHAVVLCQHFLGLGVHKAPTQGDALVVLGAGAAPSVPLGEGKLQLC